MNTRLFSFLGIASLLLSSCQAMEQEGPATISDKHEISITGTLPEDVLTKMDFSQETSAISLSWSEQDALSVVSNTGDASTFTLESREGGKARFKGLSVNGSTFSIYYPGTVVSDQDWKAFSYLGQTQTGNGDLSHLKSFFSARITGLDDYSDIVFQAPAGGTFDRSGVIKFYLQLHPAVKQVTEVSLTSTAGDVFLTNNDATLSSVLSLSLSDCTLGEDHILTAYLAASCGTSTLAAGSTLSVNITDGNSAKWTKDIVLSSELAIAGGKVTVIQLNNDAWDNGRPFSGGSGTQADPYLIATVGDLEELSQKVASADESDLAYRTACYRQIAPINFKGGTLYSIGNSNSTPSYFEGQYNGGGYKISNVKIVNNNSNKAHGMFGYLSGNARVSGIVIENATIESTTWNNGIIAGCVQPSSNVVIENCTVTGSSVTSNNESNGGICGKLMSGTLYNCSFQGSITTTTSAKHQAGGIVGNVSNAGCTIRECSFDGTVKAACGNVAGIAGSLHGGSSVIGCQVSAASVIEGGSIADNGINVGGIAGYVNGSSGGRIEDCTMAGTVIGHFYDIGGIAGRNQGVPIKGCTFTGTVSSDYENTKSSNAYGRVGGICGHLHGTGTVDNCLCDQATVKGSDYIGGAVGLIESGTHIQNTVVKGGTVTALFGKAGGIVGGGNGTGYVNLCSASCDVSSTGSGNYGSIGGIVGWINSTGMLVANSVFHDGSLSNDQGTSGGVGGIVGQLYSGSFASTAVINCVAFPARLSTGNSNANLAGIAGFVNSCTIRNAYSPAPASIMFFNGSASGASRGSIYGWLRGINTTDALSGILEDVYWLEGFSAGNFSGNYTYQKAEMPLSDQQMKNNGAVSRPSTSTAYASFLEALNAAVNDYNSSGNLISNVRMVQWSLSENGYPVPEGTDLDAGTGASSTLKVSLLGDSITTYQGYTPYPSNYQYPKSSYTDFTSVGQTYWYQLIYEKMQGASLEVNSSYTGTCVSNTVSKGHPGLGFLQRYTELGHPDIIFINGGTNDAWSYSLPVGSLDFSLSENELDPMQFAQAYDLLIRKMKARYPSAKIFSIIGDNVMDPSKQAYADVIRDVCNHYGVHYAEVVFPDRAAVTYDNVHPNPEGMRIMADQIYEQLQPWIYSF